MRSKTKPVSTLFCEESQLDDWHYMVSLTRDPLRVYIAIVPDSTDSD